jgi:hypothetical protein
MSRRSRARACLHRPPTCLAMSNARAESGASRSDLTALTPALPRGASPHEVAPDGVRAPKPESGFSESANTCSSDIAGIRTPTRESHLSRTRDACFRPCPARSADFSFATNRSGGGGPAARLHSLKGGRPRGAGACQDPANRGASDPQVRQCGAPRLAAVWARSSSLRRPIRSPRDCRIARRERQSSSRLSRVVELSRTSCLRSGGVKTVPHLGLQERATSSD